MARDQNAGAAPGRLPELSHRRRGSKIKEPNHEPGFFWQKHSEGRNVGFGLRANSSDSALHHESGHNVGSSAGGFQILLDLFELYRWLCLLSRHENLDRNQRLPAMDSLDRPGFLDVWRLRRRIIAFRPDFRRIAVA